MRLKAKYVPNAGAAIAVTQLVENIGFLMATSANW
jgi:hypothetical protein